MGRPKEWLPCGGELLLQRVVRIVGEAVQPVVVVAGRADQSLPPLSEHVATAFDAIEDYGPLAGLAAGFDALHGRCDAAFVVCCDQPLLRPAFITRMIELLESHPACVVRHDDRRHPLTAVYRLALRPMLGELIEAGERRAHEFARRADAHELTIDAFTDADPTLDSLCNANDEAAFERLIARIDGRAT